MVIFGVVVFFSVFRRLKFMEVVLYKVSRIFISCFVMVIKFCVMNYNIEELV